MFRHMPAIVPPNAGRGLALGCGSVPEVPPRRWRPSSPPAASTAAITSSSRTEPPGWMIAPIAGVHRQLRPVREREVRVRGERRAGEQLAAGTPAPSRPRSARRRHGSSGRHRSRSSRRRAASTIAFERTWRQTIQANSMSRHSCSLGCRADHAASARASLDDVAALHEPPAEHGLAFELARAARANAASSSRRTFFFVLQQHQRGGLVAGREQHLDELLAPSCSAHAAVDAPVDRDHAAVGALGIAGEGALVGLLDARRRPRSRRGCCA